MIIETKFNMGEIVYAMVSNPSKSDYKTIYQIKITCIVYTTKGIFYQGNIIDSLGKELFSDYLWDEKYINKGE